VPVSWADELRAVFRLRGWPPHKVEERVAAMLAERERERKALEAARRGKAPGPRHPPNGRVRRR
jgi:TPP-dependent pyruvate/acetoin dehydrogenase alpha subunit